MNRPSMDYLTLGYVVERFDFRDGYWGTAGWSARRLAKINRITFDHLTKS